MTGNKATRSGGAIFADFGALYLDDCLVANNTADEAAGIYNFEGTLIEEPTQRTTLWMRNTTFTNNSVSGATGEGGAREGGAIKSYLGYVVGINCTIAGNQCPTLGGGIRGVGCNLCLTNCIIAGNKANSPGNDNISIKGKFEGANNYIGPNPSLASDAQGAPATGK